MRLLVKAKESGAIIGKGGSSVKAIRSESGACVSVLNKNTNGGSRKEDQVLLIRGSVEEVHSGLRLVVAKLMQSSNERSENPGESLTVRMLVPSAQVGCIIGKAGATIKAISSETSTKLIVSNDKLGASSEKSVSFIGTSDNVCEAMIRVISELIAHPLAEGTTVVKYIPSAALPMGAAMGGMGGMGGLGGMGAVDPFNNYYAMQQGMQQGMQQQPTYAAPQAGHQQQMYMGGYSHVQAPVAPPPQVPKGDERTETQKIEIPCQCAGSIIGKGGSTVQQLSRRFSVNIILAHPSEDVMNKRLVTISGGATGIDGAIQAIRQLIDQYHGNLGPVSVPLVQ